MTEALPESTHARLSASSASRWMLCPGSVRLSQGVPSTSSEYAAEGTYAHHIAAECLYDGLDAADWIGKTREVDGFTFECTEEMAEAVQTYLDFIREYETDEDVVSVEVDLTPALQTLHQDFGGIADYINYRPSSKTLRVVDYKHGSGVFVSVEGNKQLKYYGLGALLESGEPAEWVELVVAQPRCGAEETIRIWRFSAVELVDFAADLLEAVEQVYAEDAPLVPGEVQCKFCPAAVKCPELEKHQNALVSMDFDIVSSDTPYMDPEQLAEALRIFPLVESRISQIREYAYQEGLKGTPPPGFKVVEKVGRRKWKDEAEAEAWADMILGDGAFTQPKLKTAPQIEKLLDKEDKKELEDLVEMVSSGYTLVPESDKRPPAMLAAPDEFDKVE